MALEWIKYGKPSALGIVTGMVAGLGTITPASGFVGPAGAVVFGFCAGLICFYATLTIKRKLKIDDSLDVFPVHGVGGMLGTFLAGIFASAELGLFSGQGLAQGMSIGSQLLVQLTGIGATLVYAGVATYMLLKLLSLFGGLRVSPDEETEGLDIVLHNESGYDL
jgi:Amt family ammonium transporter